MVKLPKLTGRNPGRVNQTEAVQGRMIEVLTGSEKLRSGRIVGRRIATVEVGNLWMRLIPRADIGMYRPLLGGYPLQEEARGNAQVSVDNIREIVEQLGRPFLITAHHHGILFHWNGTLGGTETYAALGFALHHIGSARKALASLCAELGMPVRLPSRRTRAKRLGKTGSFRLFHDRWAHDRDWHSISKKRWVEVDVA